MTARLFPAALAALTLLLAPTAIAQAPLGGTGENIQAITRVPMLNPNEIELAGDWAFVSSDYGGLVIVNVADPTKPFIEGKWDCVAGWADIDISADANLVVLTNAHSHTTTPECLETTVSNVLIDTTNKKQPKLVGVIPYDADNEYIHTSTLDNNLLYLNPQAAAFFPQGESPHIPIWDISNPAAPVKKGFVESTGVGLAHDSYVDHRPDGKSLLYSASIHTSDIFDVTDPFAATMIQRTASPEISISHDVQPNFKRDMIIVDDEGAAGGQLDENVSACGKIGGPGPAAIDSGSVHFYAAAPDGTFANAGAVELGSWNAPTNVNTGACVAHVFWQAPDDNRLTQAYYRTGAFILDFNDPANAKMLGSFFADGGANYWSAKPHNGYLYATNQDGGLDILRYTGEGGAKWPATSGPAEIQRAARYGIPYVPLKGASTPTPPPAITPEARALGAVKFTAKLKKVPGKKGSKARLTVTFTKAGKTVGTARVSKAAAKKGTVKVTGVAVTGTYNWTIKAGKKTLKRGKLTVKPKAGLSLSPNASVFARAR